MIHLVFPDKCVTYGTFINDHATALVSKLIEALDNLGDVISQSNAFKLFGQGNIRRWRERVLLVPLSKCSGKIEYRIPDLRTLKQRKQDYFD